MKIQYCSDLHLEFPANKKYMERHLLEPEGKVLILAGDIWLLSLHKTQSKFINFIADNFEQVSWVFSNHDAVVTISNNSRSVVERTAQQCVACE